MPLIPVSGKIFSQDINNNFSYLETRINDNLNGSPKEVFSTLNALKAKYPNGADGIYLVLENGHIYYWNSTTWTDAGAYQSAIATRENADDQVISMYPFQPRATLKSAGTDSSSVTPLYNGIKNIELYGKDPKKQYYMSLLWRNRFYSSNNTYIWSVVINEVGTGSAVCQLNVANYTEPSSGLDVIDLTTINNSGVSGKMTIDWSQIPNGAGYQSMTYTETGFAQEVFKYKLPAISLEDKSLTPNQLSDYIKNNLYPFQSKATLIQRATNTSSVLPIMKGIKKIDLYGADPKKQYALGILNRQFTYNGNLIWNITIDEVNGQTKVATVCQFNVSNVAPWNYSEPKSGVDEVTLSEVNNSEITGKVIVDWNEFPIGTDYRDMYFNESGLHPLTYKELPDTMIEDEVLISLPPKIPAVIGHEMNVYFDNVIQTDDLKNYNIYAVSSVGDQQEERLNIIPTNVGDYPLTISLYKNGGKDLITSATSTIKVSDGTGGTTEKFLFIGDSHTEKGFYLTELYNLMSMELVGTRGTPPILHEGRSGWRINDYLTSSESPFVFNGVFDFGQYMSNNNFTVDNIVIMLSTNDIAGVVGEEAVNENLEWVLNNFSKFITGIRSYSTTVKVHIALTLPPAKSQDGWGKVYHAGDTKRFAFKRNVFKFVKMLIDTYSNKESESIYLVPLNLNLDTVNNFETEEVQVNSRNNTMVKRVIDSIHPDGNSGYLQVADTYYYHFSKL